MTAGQKDTLATVRSIRLAQRRKVSLAARAAAEPPRQGLLALLGAVAGGSDDPAAVLGLNDMDHIDPDVVVELAHRTQRRPS